MPTHIQVIVIDADGAETVYTSVNEAAAVLNITYATLMKRAKSGAYDVHGRRVRIVRPEPGPRRVFSVKLDDATADAFTAYLQRKAKLTPHVLRTLIVAELERDAAAGE